MDEPNHSTKYEAHMVLCSIQNGLLSLKFDYFLLIGEVSGASAPASPDPAPAAGGGASSSEEEVFDDGYDHELMGDEEDRKNLESMTQVEREKIIFERLERRDALKTRSVLVQT